MILSCWLVSNIGGDSYLFYKYLSMHDTTICLLTAAEIVKKISKGEISAVETMEAHLAQIERINPQVNAIVTLVHELALEEARKADEKQTKGGNIGPLHGLPVAHKDLVPTKGFRTLLVRSFLRISFQRKMHCSWSVYGKQVQYLLEKRIRQNLELVHRPLIRFLA